MATLQNIGKLKYRGKDGQWHPLPVVVQDADGSVSIVQFHSIQHLFRHLGCYEHSDNLSVSFWHDDAGLQQHGYVYALQLQRQLWNLHLRYQRQHVASQLKHCRRIPEDGIQSNGAEIVLQI